MEKNVSVCFVGFVHGYIFATPLIRLVKTASKPAVKTVFYILQLCMTASTF